MTIVSDDKTVGPFEATLPLGMRLEVADAKSLLERHGKAPRVDPFNLLIAAFRLDQNSAPPIIVDALGRILRGADVVESAALAAEPIVPILQLCSQNSPLQLIVVRTLEQLGDGDWGWAAFADTAMKQAERLFPAELGFTAVMLRGGDDADQD